MNTLIIFDCDGVLVDSETICNRIVTQMLTSIGYLLTEEETMRKFVGLCEKRVKKIVFEESKIEITDSFIQDTHKKIMSEFETELQALMLPVLTNDLIQKHDKCVASSSPKEGVLKSLQITSQHSFFQKEHVFTAAQVKNSKPAPDLFLYAADQMGYHPKNCLVIEDSIAGIEAAIAAEMPVIAFLGGGHTRYDWYRERIFNKKVPVAHTQEELLQMLTTALS